MQYGVLVGTQIEIPQSEPQINIGQKNRRKLYGFPHLVEIFVKEDLRGNYRSQRHGRNKGRINPLNPAGIKIPERKRTVLYFRKNDAGNEESRDDKENVHPQESSGQPAVIQVENNDG